MGILENYGKMTGGTKITKQQSNYIKIVAMLSMLIDHVGVIIFPQYSILRIIGRIAFPLFAYQIGVGVRHTKNVRKYFLRLLGFGVAMQFFYAISAPSIGENPFSMNILFTLALGVGAIVCYERKWYGLLLGIIVLPLGLGLLGITLDYGVYGILLIFGMYIFQEDFRNLTFYMILITIITCIAWDYPIQISSVVALLFIAKPLSVKMNIHWSVFYIFYPVHLVILQLISELSVF